MRKSAVATLALTVTLSACAAQPSWGALEEAAGERQRVQCRGVTGPAVVVVHGIGDAASSTSFDEVTATLPDDRRVCRFDRPGAGDSPEPRRTSRDAAQLDRELDAVVRQADPGGPVVLVGHSFGGYPVLAYAARHRERVTGAVLLDAVDPELGLLTALGAPSWSEVGMAGEDLDLAGIQEQTAAAVHEAAKELSDLPLVVVRRDRNVTPAWLAAQQRLAALSQRGTLVVAAGSSHEIPGDNPGAVIEAIDRVA